MSKVRALIFILMMASFAYLGSSDDGKMTKKLQDRLNEAGNTELIPIYIVLEQVPTEGFTREELIQHLKVETAKVQKPLLDYLNTYTFSGYRKRNLDLDPKKLVEEIKPLWIANVISLKATKQVILDLKKRPDVLRMNLNDPKYELALYNPQAWGVSQIEASKVWDTFGITGEGVVVAIVDTGVDWAHPDLNDHIWTNEAEDAWTDPNDPTTGNGIDDDGNGFVDDFKGWDFVGNDNDPMPKITDPPNQGHGTHVAGTVAGDGTGGTTTGVAPEAKIMIIRTIEGGTEAGNWAGIQYAVDMGADVINMSLGWQQSWGPDNLTWREVCKNAINAGVVMVVAAGNEDNDFGPPNNLRTPGIVPEVITVGATDNLDSIWEKSSIGPADQYSDYPYPPGLLKPDVVAPGHLINSTLWGGGYSGNTWSGTSMATPHVSGAAALILSRFYGLSHYQIKEVLKSTALKLPSISQSPNNTYGYGRIDVFKTISYLLPKYKRDTLKALKPLAYNRIQRAKNLLIEAESLCSISQSEESKEKFDECCSEDKFNEVKELLELAEKFFIGGNYTAANNYALKAIAMLEEIIECLKG
ncbi:MAG: S8 family serine peptidase [Candidatus Methanofastidiosia archaeon]